MKKNEYKCAMCKNVYEKGWSDEEALQEKTEIWGDLSKEDCEVVCDDCYQRIDPMRPENAALKVQALREIKDDKQLKKDFDKIKKLFNEGINK